MIPVIVKLCESPSRAGGLLMINYSKGRNRSESSSETAKH